MIEELEESFSKEILAEICWEYIYHQNTLYEATFSTIPYLVSICEKAGDLNFKRSTFINLGIILAEMDADNEYLYQIYNDSTVGRETVDSIISSYKSSFERLKAIGQSLSDMVPGLDEGDKRYFLVGMATAHEKYDVAKVFCVYSDNDEYMCTCPHCDSEFHLWNENNRLVLYTQNPVFTKEQVGYSINPSTSKNPHFEWLVFHINNLNIQSLKPAISYLFGEVECPECKKAFDVFDAVSESL